MIFINNTNFALKSFQQRLHRSGGFIIFVTMNDLVKLYL